MFWQRDESAISVTAAKYGAYCNTIANNILHNGADMYAYVYLENSFVTLTFHQTEGLSPEEINSIIDMVDFSTID